MRNKAKKIGDATPSYPLLELIPPHKNRALRDHGLHPYHVSCVNIENLRNALEIEVSLISNRIVSFKYIRAVLNSISTL